MPSKNKHANKPKPSQNKRDRTSSSDSVEAQPSKVAKHGECTGGAEASQKMEPVQEQDQEATCHTQAIRAPDVFQLTEESGFQVITQDNQVLLSDDSSGTEIVQYIINGINDLRMGQIINNQNAEFLMKQMQKNQEEMKSDLTKLRKDLHDELKEESADIKKHVDQRIKKVEEDYQRRINSLDGKVEEVKRKTQEIEPLRDRVVALETMASSSNCPELTTPTVADIDFTILVLKAPRMPTEELKPYCTELVEATGVEDVTICDVERLRDMGEAPGHVKFTVTSKAKRNEITKNGSKLKETAKFSRVFIRNSLPEAVRIQRANQATLIREMNLGDVFKYDNRGRLVKKTWVPERGRSTGSGTEQALGSRLRVPVVTKGQARPTDQDLHLTHAEGNRTTLARKGPLLMSGPSNQSVTARSAHQ